LEMAQQSNVPINYDFDNSLGTKWNGMYYS